MIGYPSNVQSGGLVFFNELSEQVTIAGDDFHHLFRVRRTQSNTTLVGADGLGNWREYHVSEVKNNKAELLATGTANSEPIPGFRLSVACATTKGQKPEHTAAQLTEIGVNEIVFFTAERSQLKINDQQFDRFAKVVRESAMQSRRAKLPEITHSSLAQLLKRESVVVADLVGEPELPEFSGDLTILIGPEGGWSDNERLLMGDRPKWKLGNFVLRAATAAISAAAQATYCGRSATNSPS